MPLSISFCPFDVLARQRYHPGVDEPRPYTDFVGARLVRARQVIA